MNKEDMKMDFWHMKKERYSRTDLLSRFKSGWATIIYSNGIAKRIYRLDTDKGSFVLKVINCSINDQEQLDMAKNEFELASKAYKLSKNVTKPIACKTATERAGDIAAIESLYEYGGENLIVGLRDASSKRIVNVMRKVVNVMIILHENNIFHSDLKPTNIVYKEGIPKIIDFGVSMALDSHKKIKDTTSGGIIGFTEAYCPPELIRRKKYARDKVDVYSWGMTLYHLVARKSSKELLQEAELKRSDKGYMVFLERVAEMELEDDRNGVVRSSLLRIMRRVFALDHRNRPTFVELKEMFDMDDYYYKEEDHKEEDSPKTAEESPVKAVSPSHSLKPAEEIKVFKTPDSSPKGLKQKPAYDSELVKALFTKLKVSAAEEVCKEIERVYESMYIHKSEKVCLYCLCIGHEGAEIIAQGMLAYGNLTLLQLAFCKIGVEGAQALSKGLEHCSKLKEFYLGDHNSKFEERDDASVDSSDSNENKLDYYLEFANVLDLEGTKAICDGLSGSYSLEVLDLSHCNINVFAIPFIVKLADRLKSLKLLFLNNNPKVTKKNCKLRSGLDVKFDPV
eukprot:TRINITY_DN3572_c0_g1_i3.p1 TRINITY_DN3572_c0_g1~~TRINITY_DN3572_c0_g1_i3.p1  ORF type:complete len:566 (-),score=197.66 TRINITY_DN3572_c0_g1_i3:145-1842(-)